ncbi:MAG: hypothetical protein KGL39_11525 [Patescibacteria group bacterium]|nr:hypothetical protein [Patescibacteria group bacterium]
MSITYCQIVYNNPSTGNVTLNFQRGPQNFECFYSGRVHNNVATGGLKERVTEFLDILIAFEMQNHVLSDATDYEAWGAFMGFALAGAQFTLCVNTVIGTAATYDCVCDDEKWQIKREGPGRYSASYNFRLVPDSTWPAGGPALVMRQYYGYTS